MNHSYKLLIVDDSPNTLEILKRNLESAGYDVLTATRVNTAMEILEKNIIDLVITDYKMPGMSGMELIRHVKDHYREMEVIMITGYATIEKAVEAVKLGAEEYLPKPFTDEELFNAVEKSLNKVRLKRQETYKSKFSGFHELMPFQIHNILLVSSKYDAFVLEEDGRITDRMFGDFVNLDLRFIPKITQVSTASEAYDLLQQETYDLVISMPRISGISGRKFCKKVKELKPNLITVMLTYTPVDSGFLRDIRHEQGIDKVFYWQGNSRLLFSIIKYAEDKINAQYDVTHGVKIILLVEDSPWYYSFFLPILYTEILHQTNHLITEGINNLDRLMRMRARPKIVMAETYEEAISLYQTYKKNLLGVITDVSFRKKDEIDPVAGFKLAKRIKSDVFDIPVLLQSTDRSNKTFAYRNKMGFLYKKSPSLTTELRSFMLGNFGFGDFIFRMPDGSIVTKASNLEELAKVILTVPEESLEYHSNRNHISIWLRARTEFELAEKLRPKKISDFHSIEEARQAIHDVLKEGLNKKKEGIISDLFYIPDEGDSTVVRIGNGSLGGKARGLAFINNILLDSNIQKDFPEINIKTPKTFAVCTEVFELFIDNNSILEKIKNLSSDKEISSLFLEGTFPIWFVEKAEEILKHITQPVAVRSSSMLEDSQNLPFAGIYKTFMLPNNHPEFNVRRQQLLNAIRLVYASVFQKISRRFTESSNHHIEEEKMGVIIQQVTGIDHGSLYYPILSGVAQSTTFYPVAGIKPDDGIAQLAIGLGKGIVEGEKSYTFSPVYPESNPPFASAEEMLSNSQNSFYALNLSNPDIEVIDDEEFSLNKCNLYQAEKDGVFRFTASTYSPDYRGIRDTLSIDGPRVITFAPILKHKLIPLAPLLKELLRHGENAFGCPVEMEFSLNMFHEKNRPADFYFLQIRPIMAKSVAVNVTIEETNRTESFLYSSHALGNGYYPGLHDIIAVRPDSFSVTKTRDIALDINRLNRELREKNTSYILIGFGRWGTNDPSLGIPVTWDQISSAKVIVETYLKDFNVEPSQGSHFFHNMLSLGLGYMHLSPFSQDDFMDWEWLTSMTPIKQTEYLFHYHFDKPLRIMIDGKSTTGLILKE